MTLVILGAYLLYIAVLSLFFAMFVNPIKRRTWFVAFVIIVAAAPLAAVGVTNAVDAGSYDTACRELAESSQTAPEVGGAKLSISTQADQYANRWLRDLFPGVDLEHQEVSARVILACATAADKIWCREQASDDVVVDWTVAAVETSLGAVGLNQILQRSVVLTDRQAREAEWRQISVHPSRWNLLPTGRYRECSTAGLSAGEWLWGASYERD